MQQLTSNRRQTAGRRGKQPLIVRTTAVLFAAAFSLLGTAQSQSAAAVQSGDQSPKVVIPFDFESKFDHGRYGKMVGEMIWKKLEKRGGFVIPESMLDVREWSDSAKFVPSPDTPLAKMKSILRDEFGGDIAIWGKVERLPHVDWDKYDLWIYIADFSVDPPKMLVKLKAQTKTVSEIPHVYVKQSLDKLYGVDPAAVANASDPEREKRWRDNPNLVHGDFETLKGWDPPTKLISRQTESGPNGRPNHFLRFTIPKDVAATTGVLYYSDYFPVQAGATYRFQCRWRTSGSAVKVFIKCYDEMESRFSKLGNASGSVERREVYRSQQNLKGPKNTWNVQTEDFTPRHTQYEPKWGRVMLYGYWPAGTVDWDDVVVKQIAPPPKYEAAKVRRPSLETKVRTDEFERARGIHKSPMPRRPPRKK